MEMDSRTVTTPIAPQSQYAVAVAAEAIRRWMLPAAPPAAPPAAAEHVARLSRAEPIAARAAQAGQLLLVEGLLDGDGLRLALLLTRLHQQRLDRPKLSE